MGRVEGLDPASFQDDQMFQWEIRPVGIPTMTKRFEFARPHSQRLPSKQPVPATGVNGAPPNNVGEEAGSTTQTQIPEKIPEPENEI